MELLPDDWKRINGAILSMYRELDPTAHAGVMLAAIASLVPADTIVLNWFDVSDGSYSVRTLPEGVASPGMTKEVEKHLHESPFPAYYVATGDPRWKMTTDFMPLEDFRELALYHSMRPWNIEIQMCGMLAFIDGVAHAITVNRSSGGFTEKERTLLDVLHPHLVTSYLNALSCAKSLGKASMLETVIDGAPGAYGYLDKLGRVSWLQPRATEWLATYFSGETYRNQLPVRVQELAETIRTTGRDAGHLEVPGDSGTLFISVASSSLGGWLLRLELRPKLLPSRFSPLDGLSNRENDVLRWMVEGKRNLEIATILSISTRTVEKHISAILDHFGVENRGTAIVRAMEAHAQKSAESSSGDN